MTGSLKKSYDEQGFCVVPQVVSPLEVEALREEVEAIADGYDRLPDALKENILLLKDLSERQLGDLEPDTLGNVPYLMGELPAFSSTFTGAICQQRIWDAVQAVLECEALHYHFSNVTMKPKRVGPKINWHRDYPNRYICPATSSFTRVLLCLDGMDPDNGCTQVVKGSHLISDEEARAGGARLVTERSHRGNCKILFVTRGTLFCFILRQFTGALTTALPRTGETSSCSLAVLTLA